MKIQLRDTGFLAVGCIIGIVLALLLVSHRLQLSDEAENNGGSIVGAELKQRAVRKLLELDLSKTAGCVETRKIVTKPVSFAEPGVLTERWSVQRCGSTAFYNVQFIPSPQGDIDVVVSIEN
jgi:hypothetical protein